MSHSLTAINIDWFMEITEFYKRIDDFVSTIKKLPLRPDFDEILVPGEIENKRVEEKMKFGIPLDNEVILSFEELADKLKIESNLRLADTYLQYDKEVDTSTATHDEEVDGISSILLFILSFEIPKAIFWAIVSSVK